MDMTLRVEALVIGLNHLEVSLVYMCVVALYYFVHRVYVRCVCGFVSGTIVWFVSLVILSVLVFVAIVSLLQNLQAVKKLSCACQLCRMHVRDFLLVCLSRMMTSQCVLVH